MSCWDKERMRRRGPAEKGAFVSAHGDGRMDLIKMNLEFPEGGGAAASLFYSVGVWLKSARKYAMRSKREEGTEREKERNKKVIIAPLLRRIRHSAHIPSEMGWGLNSNAAASASVSPAAVTARLRVPSTKSLKRGEGKKGDLPTAVNFGKGASPPPPPLLFRFLSLRPTTDDDAKVATTAAEGPVLVIIFLFSSFLSIASTEPKTFGNRNERPGNNPWHFCSS